MILDSLFPVFALIALGVVLRRRGLTDRAFLRQGDRLVYYVFFPVLLFWKIGGASAADTVPWSLWGAGLGTILILWVVSLVALRLFGIGPRRAGSFSQAAFRFNTYVAIAVVLGAQGDAGAARLGELLSVAIPAANVLAVVTFIWFARGNLDQASRVRLTLGALIRNPLILACLGGMVWARLLPAWPVAVDRALQLTASLTLPFALISIGGALTFTGIRDRLVPALVATVLKIAAMPLIGWWLLDLFGITGADRLTAMLFFAMPASTAMYVLSTEMDGDPDLSSAIIVLSTLGAFVSLSAVLVLFG